MRILFSGGGTGGTLVPLIAVAEAITDIQSDAEIRFVITSAETDRALLEHTGFPFATLDSGKLRRYFHFRNITDVFLSIGAFFKARKLLKEIRPDVVMSAGSFASVPVAWAAKFQKIPVLIHQQDVERGLSNALMEPVASRVTVSLEKSLAHFSSKKVVLTGNPVRKAILIHAEHSDSHADMPTLLVLGGSTGAHGLNMLVKEASPEITKVCHIDHYAGAREFDEFDLPERHTTFHFLGEGIAPYYRRADIVLCRAGMGTISELSALGKAAIIIPMPRTHQKANAEFIKKNDAAVVLDQEKLTAEELSRVVIALCGNTKHRMTLGRNIQSIMPHDAAHSIARLLLECAQGCRE